MVAEPTKSLIARYNLFSPANVNGKNGNAVQTTGETVSTVIFLIGYVFLVYVYCLVTWRYERIEHESNQTALRFPDGNDGDDNNLGFWPRLNRSHRFDFHFDMFRPRRPFFNHEQRLRRAQQQQAIRDYKEGNVFQRVWGWCKELAAEGPFHPREPEFEMQNMPASSRVQSRYTVQAR